MRLRAQRLRPAALRGCSRSRRRARSRRPRAAPACRCGPSRSAPAAPVPRGPGQAAGSHTCERMNALAQCRNASLRSTPITAFGGLPRPISCCASSAGSLRDRRAAVDAQRLGHARDQEEQADLAGLRDVAERVEAVVAARVGNHEPRVVEHRDEPGRAAARRDVAAALGVGRRDEDERRERDVGATVGVERRDGLRPHPLVGLLVELVELARGADDVVEGHVPSLPARTPERVDRDFSTCLLDK